MRIDFQAFLDSFIYMGIGMAGIFFIIGMLVLMLHLFYFIFPNKDKQ